jgi:hypothetical protein
MVITKEAVELAQKELKEEMNKQKIAEIKRIVLGTLERIDEYTKAKDRIEEKIKVLKSDIDDLKSGRLDKIEDRQVNSPVAREVSLIKVCDKELVIDNPMNNLYTIATPFGTLNVNGWSTVNYTSGTYKLPNRTIYLR